MKKFLAGFLAFVLMLTNFLSIDMGYVEAGTKGLDEAIVDSEEMSVKGTSSFGKMLSDSLAAKADEQESNEGCNIFSIEIKGREAEVSFETDQEAAIVISIYEDDGVKMLGSGKVDVSKEDTEIIVPIEIDTMPSSFYLRGFLIEKTSLRPLCNVYESPNYTKDMKEFFDKTTDDFPADRVLDLDGDKMNNFAVYSDKVTVISGGGIEVKNADEDKNTYVFENADSIAALQQGDIFSYSCKDGNVILVKIRDIQCEGATVTVTGMDTSMEDVFEYVKIDTKSDISDIKVNPSGCDEGVKYNGIVEEPRQKAHLNAFEGEETVSRSLSYEFLKEEDKDESDNGDKKKGIYGNIHFTISASIKVYISSKRQYLEMKLDYEVGPNIQIAMENEAKVRLGFLKIFPIPGVEIELTPSFIVKASASVTIEGALKGTFGFAADSGKGIQNLTKKPHLETELNGEFTIAVGLSLEPEITIVCEELANASMDVSAVAQAKGELSYSSVKEDDPSVIHECHTCIDGDISGVLELEFNMQLLKSKKLKLKYTKAYTIKLCDWYYSGDFQEFGFTTCPHCLYKTAITVRGLIKKIPGAEVEVPFLVIEKDENGNEQQKRVSSVMTDENGRVTGYLPSGKYTVTVTAQNYKKGTKKIKIEDDAKSIGILLFPELSGGDSGDVGDNEDKGDQPKPPVDNSGAGENITPKKDLQTFSLGSGYSGAITEDGSLYMWGDNYAGQIGDGTTNDVLKPKKILEHVKSLSLAYGWSAAVKEDGSLYVWGIDWNYEGDQIKYELPPTKIMDQVRSISLGRGFAGAIKEDGSLYMWGYNNSGGIGSGTMHTAYTPTKILDNVESVCLGENHSGAITKDGSLYMWGNNDCGQVGNATTNHVLKPIEILKRVKSVSLGMNNSGAITEDGSLYMWGNNYARKSCCQSAQVNILTPTKVFEHAESVSLGDYHSGVVTKDGSLYMWGANYGGQIGDVNTSIVEKPIKILDNVVSISLGTQHSGAVTKNGNLYMWGRNSNGEVGNGTTKNVVNPTKILDNIKLTHTLINTAQMKNITVNQELPFSIKKIGTIIPSMSVNEGSSKMVSFTELKPNAVYNFYVLKSKTADELLEFSNLLYITQAAAGVDGSLKVFYQTGEDSTGAEVFAVNAEAKQIALADVYVQDLEYNQKLQYIHPIVTDQGKALEEWEDYELYGDYSATNVGNYTVTVHGIGDYKGFINTSYKITEAKRKKIERITLSVADASLNTGKTLQLRAEVFPEDAENKEVQWKSSDPQVASVDDSGFVTAFRAGTATITVKSLDGSGVSASCVITVTRVAGNSGGSSSGGSTGTTPSGEMSGNTDSHPSEDNSSNEENREVQVKLLYYIVDFNANGGTRLSRKTMTLLMDDMVGILPKIQRKKYDFKGWYTQKSGGKKVKQTDVLNVSTTLYAQWKKTAKPSKPAKVSLAQKKGKKVKVRYKKVTGASGYQIDYSTSKKFILSGTKKVTTVSTEKILDKLKKGSTYYVRVRAYQMDSAGNKIYGAYSGAKKIKVKV